MVDRLTPLLETLEKAQLLRYRADRDPTLLFKHALTQEAAYESLLIKRREELHQLVAMAYESLYSDQLDEYLALLAVHYGQSGNNEKTAEYSIRAGEGAKSLFAFHEASIHYARAIKALRKLPDTEVHRRARVDTLLNYLEWGWGTGIVTDAFEQANQAEVLARTLPNADGTRGDRQRLARTHAMKAALYLAQSEYPQALDYARDVIDQGAAFDNPSLLATPSAQCGAALALQGHFAEAERYLERASALLEQEPDRWEWSWSLGLLGITYAMQGRIDAGLDQAQRAIAVTEKLSSQAGLAQSRVFLLPILMETDDVEGFFRESVRAVEVARESRFPIFLAIGLGLEALARSRLGEHPSALETLERSNEAKRDGGGQLMMSDWLAAAFAEVHFSAGRIEGAMVMAERAALVSKNVGGIFAEAWARRVLGQALREMSPNDGGWDEQFSESIRLFKNCRAHIEAGRTVRIHSGAM